MPVLAAEPRTDPKVQAYIDGVLSGGIIVCKYVRQAVERHVNDLATGEERGLWFDYEEAGLTIDFIECLKHSKGEWAGKPLILEPFEAFITWCIFGWKKTNNTRRFNTAFISEARKNGKTTIGATYGHKLFVADGEAGAEVYAAATKRDQAKILHEESKRMVRKSPYLASIVQILRDNLYIAETESRFEPLGADADTLDGLNPSGVIIDELHAHKTRKVWDVMETGTGSRRNPLTIGITTAGDVGDADSIYMELKAYTIKVLSGVIEDDSWFGIIYTLDSEPYNEPVSDFRALVEMESQCTCQLVPITQIERFAQEACANHATTKRITPIDAEPIRLGGSGKNPGSDCTTKRMRIGQQDKNSAPASNTSLDLQNQNTTECVSSETESVISVEGSQATTSCASITTILRESLGDCFADPAIRRLVFSEIVSKAFNGHSPICKVREWELQNGRLLIQRPPDDWTDPACWIKANPNLGVSVKLDDLQRKFRKAIETPSAQSNFRRKHLNQETETSNPWLTTDEGSAWSRCCGGGNFYGSGGLLSETIERFRGRSCWVGGDLSSVSDLTALVFAFPGEDSKMSVVPFCWCPRENALGRDRDKRVPYMTWAGQGFLSLTEGNSVDYDALRELLRTARDQWGWVIEKVAFDPNNARYLLTKLVEEDGFNSEGQIVEHFQTTNFMNDPIGATEKLILDGKLRHGGHPVLRWCVSNATVYNDTGGRRRFNKKAVREKIDLAVAMVMAVGLAVTAGSARSYYDDHEVRYV